MEEIDLGICRALLASPRTANVTGAHHIIDGALVKTA